MLKLKKMLCTSIAIMLAASLMVGCNNDTKTNANAGASDKGKTEASKFTGPKILKLSGTSDGSFNPHTENSSETGILEGYIYGNLLDLVADESGKSVKFVPNHAKELPTTTDNKVWTFKLKDNIKWSDGTPITAKNYEYSYKMLLDPKLANYSAMVLTSNIPVVNAQKYFKGQAKWEDVGIKALDDKTLEVKLETAMPKVDVYSVFAGGGSTSPVNEKLYEAGMNAERTETKYATTLETTPSCGAYKLTQWTRDQIRIFEKNKDDAMASVYVPDRIESRVVMESATRLQLFEKKEIDSVSVSGANFDKYSEDPRLVYTEANTVWGFYINSASDKNPILKNNDFRKALYYGTNRETIAKGIFKTFKPVPYFISTLCLVGDPDSGKKYRDTDEAKAILPKNNGYDEKLAKEYFDKAYAANGSKPVTIELTYFDGQDTMKQLAEAAQENYQNLFGKDKMEVKLKAMPASAAYDSYTQGNFDMGIGARSQNSFNPWSSMKVWTSTFPSKNDRFYSKEFDDLYTRTTTGDLLLKDKERMNALCDMEKMLIDYVPMVPIFQNDNAMLFQNKIKLKTQGKFLPGGVGFAALQSDITE